MGKMAMDENGHMVPLESLMKPKIVEKKEVVVEKEIPETPIVSEDSTPVSNVESGPIPEGCSACTKPDVVCGLRQAHYCKLSPDSMCDYDSELEDIKSGNEVAPPRGSGKAREIDMDREIIIKPEATEAELRAMREKHEKRFDNLSAKELKVKCDKLEIPYRHNESKVKLIAKIKAVMEGPEEEEVSPSSKL